VSKKVFKQALGDLYKQDLISLHANGIELTVKGKTSGVED
jgi:predicted RNA-binding protein (virulence factor B family)